MKGFLVLFVSCIFIVSCEKKRTASVQLIPNNYQGVVVTIWGEENHPPLPIANGSYIEKYPDSGIIITSTKLEYGWASDATYYVDKNGIKVKKLYYDGAGDKIIFGAIGYTQQGSVQVDYSFTAVGNDEYWKVRDGSEYDKKTEEAVNHALQLRER